MERGPMALFGAIVAVGLGPALWLGAQFGNIAVSPSTPPAVDRASRTQEAPAAVPGAAPEDPTVEIGPSPRSQIRAALRDAVGPPVEQRDQPRRREPTTQATDRPDRARADVDRARRHRRPRRPPSRPTPADRRRRRGPGSGAADAAGHRRPWPGPGSLTALVGLGQRHYRDLPARTLLMLGEERVLLLDPRPLPVVVVAASSGVARARNSWPGTSTVTDGSASRLRYHCGSAVAPLFEAMTRYRSSVADVHHRAGPVLAAAPAHRGEQQQRPVTHRLAAVRAELLDQLAVVGRAGRPASS